MLNTNHARSRQSSSPQRVQRVSGQQPRNGVWQDNPTPPTARRTTTQPAPLKNSPRPQESQTKTQRSQKPSSSQRHTIHLTLWVRPRVKAELQRIAEQEGISVSAAGAAFLERALQQSIYTQQQVLLDPIIDKAIGKHFRSYSSRLAVLLVRVAFASEQTRSLVTNILGRQPGVTPEVLNRILDGSSSAAKGKITYKSPQLESIIAEVEQWFSEQEHKTTG
jgi:hypothetical protein